MSVPAIGSVLTPAGFTIFSAEAQVLLSWSATPLATTFYVNRSTDNITFTNIAQVATLTYNDASAVVGTIYYYQVQAGNGTYASLPTAALAGQALSPGQTTLANLRLMCLQRCNKENSNFYTVQELNSMVSQSYKELYDILAQKFGNDWYVALPYVFVANGVSQSYPLPLDHYKLLGVDVSLNINDPSAWVSLRKYEFVQRNLFNYRNVYTLNGATNSRYRLQGTNVSIVPVASSGQTLRLWYAPRPSQLILDTSIVDGVSGWEEYIVADVCIKALAKEESDVTVYAAQKAALLKRIEEAAENRDVGEPETVSDSKSRNFGWFDDGGECGDL